MRVPHFFNVSPVDMHHCVKLRDHRTGEYMDVCTGDTVAIALVSGVTGVTVVASVVPYEDYISIFAETEDGIKPVTVDLEDFDILEVVQPGDDLVLPLLETRQNESDG